MNNIRDPATHRTSGARGWADRCPPAGPGAPIVRADETGYRVLMGSFRLVRLVARVCLPFAVLAGCAGSTVPYVYKAGEFDRSSPNFGKEPTDITSVTICYGTRGTTPEEIRDMAQTECAQFEKTARFTDQNYQTCPLLTPVAAYFDCVKP